MRMLYLNEQGALVRRRYHRLVVVRGNEILAEVPVHDLSGVSIFGNVQVTTQAMALVLEAGVDVSFFSLGGRLRGRLSSGDSKNVFLRLAQHSVWLDKTRRLELAKCLVEAKIHNQRSVIMRHHRNHPESQLNGVAVELRELWLEVKKCTEIITLMGLEGRASAVYFRGFPRMLRHGQSFPGRLRHPPPDPVNALLSLGYAMITNEMAALLEGASFDPYLGFYHGVRYGRKSLALDMIEPFRQPLIDSFTLHLLNNRIIKTSDFEPRKNGGMYLTDDARRKYFHAYEQRMAVNTEGFGDKSWRGQFHEQIESLRNAIMG